MKKEWNKLTLKDLCIVDWGNTNLTKASYIKNGEFLAISAAGCDGRIGHKEHSKHTPVLSAIGAQCGKMFFPEEDFTAIKNTITLTPIKERCDGKFLYYLLTFVELPQRGAGQPFISKGDIQRFSVSAPALPEQRRIVAILDEAFEGIAVAKANAERNLQNARALFESYLESVFSEAWANNPIGTLSDIASDITDGDHMPPKKVQEGVPFITIGDINKENHEIDFSETYRVSRSYFNSLKHNRRPQNGDVLYTVTGSFGIPVLISNNTEFCFQRHIGLVRPRKEVSSDWLYFLLLSPQIRKQAIDGVTGTAQKTVSLKVLRNFKVPIIPINDQIKIATKSKNLMEESRKLASNFQKKIAALDELKKSLLHEAFSGRL